MNDQHEDTPDFFDESPGWGPRRWMSNAISWLGGWAVAWWVTRRWWRLAAGVPAVLVAGLILLPAVLYRYVDAASVISRYQQELRYSIGRNDAAAADVFMQRLIRAGVSDLDTRYAMAIVLMRRGDKEQAEKILKELAADEKGHPRAHLWMAGQLAGDKTDLSAEEREEIAKHLRIVLENEPESADANVMLGKLAIQSEDLDAAVRHFKAAVSQRPDLHLSLAQIYRQRGEPQLAKQSAKEAVEVYRQRSTEKPDNVDARVAWALAYRFQEDFSQAGKVLQEGLQGDPGNATLRSFRSSFLIDEFDSLSQTDPRAVDRRLQLLESALAYAPNHPGAIERLAIFADLEGESGDRVREKMQEALVSGKATATIHLILAIQAVVHQDLKKAELHLEQGYTLNPNMPALLNNYAWLLANRDPPQLDRALELANRAIESVPTDPNFRETRGQIYVKLERWQEALADLEFALPSFSGNREIHAALAKVYRQLGDDEIAEIHERRAANP